MPFQRQTIKAGSLKAATPTPLDATALQTQLQNIGLSCAQINQQNLSQYINEVTSQMPVGTTQVYAIKAPSTDFAPQAPPPTGLISLAAAVPTLTDSATGNWTIDPTGDGYGPNLIVIQYPDHFNWLYNNRATNGFAGIVDSPPAYTGDYSNAAAIQNLFVNVSVTASATVVKGIDVSGMQAAMSNAIQPLANADLSNYNVSDSRVLFLVDNYNPSTGYADGLGFVAVNWTLNITDYQRKSKDGGDTHPTSLTIQARSVLYSDPSTLCNDYNSVLKQFNIDPSSAPSCSSS